MTNESKVVVFIMTVFFLNNTFVIKVCVICLDEDKVRAKCVTFCVPYGITDLSLSFFLNVLDGAIYFGTAIGVVGVSL